MTNYATRRTDSQYAVAGTMTVASGAPVDVYCVELSGITGAVTVFTIYDGDGTTVRGVVRVAADVSISWGCPHKADAGIAIKSDKVASSCTVFHGSPGN
jgi:hypothetical protein